MGTTWCRACPEGSRECYRDLHVPVTAGAHDRAVHHHHVPALHEETFELRNSQGPIGHGDDGQKSVD